jgi:hypothetical protein
MNKELHKSKINKWGKTELKANKCQHIFSNTKNCDIFGGQMKSEIQGLSRVIQNFEMFLF